MLDTTAGLHLILVPKSGFLLSEHFEEAFTHTLEDAIRGSGAVLYALSVRADHLHILLSVEGIHGLHVVLDTIVESLQGTISESERSMSKFRWDQGVHVTLLPPWHIEIMASFVRDQQRYHRTHTLEQELDEVFRPNSINFDDETEQESTLCVN